MDLAAKTYYDHTILLVGIHFAEGDSVYHRQRWKGKLLLCTEEPYTYLHYANSLCTSTVVWDPAMKGEVHIYSSLLVLV